MRIVIITNRFTFNPLLFHFRHYCFNIIYMERRELNALYHKNGSYDEIKSHHYIISFDPKDTTENRLTGEQAQQLGLEYAKKNFTGHQALVCTHLDRHNESGNDVVKSIIGYGLRGDRSLKMKVCRKHFDHINECIDTLEKAISDLSKPYHKSSKRLCSWAGLTPQNNENAGKKKSVHISRAGVCSKPLLVQCANAAIKDKKNPYFKYKYDRIKKRRGYKRGIIAIARMMLTCLYHMF